MEASQNGYTATLSHIALGQADKWLIYLIAEYELTRELAAIETLCRSESMPYGEYTSKKQILSNLREQNRAYIAGEIPSVEWSEP